MIAPVRPSPGRFAGATLLSLLALATALIGESLAARARTEVARIEGAATVQVLAPQSQSGVAFAAHVLRRTPGVRAATPMGAARAAQLLEGRVDPADLPPLSLVEVRRDASAGDAKLTAALEAANVRAAVHSAVAKDERRIAQLAAAGGGGGAMLALIALAVGFSIGVRRNESALAADLGAPRGVVLAAVGREAAGHGFAAGLVAAIVASLGAAGVLSVTGDPVSLGGMIARITAPETALVLAAPLAAAAAATLGARAGAARAYDRADRLG